MGAGDRWIDLLDPTLEQLSGRLPQTVHESVLERLLAAAEHADEPRPKLESQGEYVFGVFLVPVAVGHEDVIFYQEVDVVITRDLLVTVRKTPPEDRPPYDVAAVHQACREDESVGMLLYHLVDDVAEHFLDLIDEVNVEIDELEDHVETWPSEQVRERLSHLRHDLLHIRRTLAPTRDAVREVVDNRIEFVGEEVLTRDIELSFGAAYDKLLRATEGLELSRDLIAGVRDYHQAKVAQDQNEVMKTLTVIAALILVPTFIVGLYGQNFVNIPEFKWRLGYAWSWGLIVVVTLIQLWWFRRKRWL